MADKSRGQVECRKHRWLPIRTEFDPIRECLRVHEECLRCRAERTVWLGVPRGDDEE